MFSQPIQGHDRTSEIPHRRPISRRRSGGFRSLLLPALACTLALLGLAGCNSPFGPRLTPTPTQPTATPAPPTATPQPMAATVNGEGITVREFTAQVTAYKNAQASLGKPVGEQDASKAVIEDLIAELLLAQG